MGNRSSVPEDPISITYNTPTRQNVTEKFDYLVVACDPRNININDRTSFEKHVNKVLHSHTFHTSLFSAKRPKSGKPEDTRYVVRFDPNALEAMDGEVYGFRDEVMTRDDEGQKPSANGETWTVTYQLEDRPLIGDSVEQREAELNVKRDKNIVDAAYVDWTTNGKNPVSHEITVDYFGHFKKEELDDHMPWKVLEKQGTKRTLYVASFTCFESVLHCYLYQNKLMEQDHVKDSFPKNENARIAVIGAGPAGLLFASQQLKAKGYNNYKIFESSDRYGGKTVTEYRQAPADADRSVACELGTCYLSSAYFPLYDLFKQYDVGPVIALDAADISGKPSEFRSIIDPKLAINDDEKANGIEYGAWSTYRKNGLASAAEGESAIARAGVLYILYHVCAFGMTPEDCMPKKPPSKLRSIRNLFRVLAWIGLDETASDVTKIAIGNIMRGLLSGSNPFEPDGNAELVDDAKLFHEVCEKADVKIELKEILRMFTINPLTVTFGDFLDQLGLQALKPTMVYGYQVQGYGTITRIPAYYG